MGQGKDFLLGGGFGVIGGWIGYHEGYHNFQVGPIHGLVGPVMYDIGIWFARCPLSPPPKGPPLGSLLPPPSKGPPLPLLIGTIHPLISDLLTSPIGDGPPLWSCMIFQ